MYREEKYRYLQSLVNCACENGFHADMVSNWDNRIVIRRKIYGDAFLLVELERHNSLTIIAEVCKSTSMEITDIKIDEPHDENLIQFVKLYFEHGRGADPNNPTMEELINIGSNKIKSAKII